MSDLAGKIIWVTGAGSGIGRAAALRLAAAGASVVLTGRRPEPLYETRTAIAAEGGSADVASGDIAETQTARRVVDEIVARHGRLDVYVGSAGYNIRTRQWSELSADQIDEILRANLHGAFYASLAALAVMRRAKSGLLIHVASWSGKRVAAFSGPAYTAAKHAVIAMSESINIEAAREGIRSTVISPGGVDTPLLDKLPLPLPKEARARLLRPEDCADLIHFVATRPPHVRIDDVMITPAVQGI